MFNNKFIGFFINFNLSSKNQLLNKKISPINFNKITVNYNNKIFELKNLKLELNEYGKLNFNFNGKTLEMLNLFLFFLVKQFRVILIETINYKIPELKNHFNSMDLLEIFTIIINIILFNDFFKNHFPEHQQKIIKENSGEIIIDILQNKNNEKILEKIHKLMLVILNNIPNKINLEIKINGKLISNNILNNLFHNKEIIKIFSEILLLFLNTMKLFIIYTNTVMCLKDEDLLIFIKAQSIKPSINKINKKKIKNYDNDDIFNDEEDL